jgi:hypothetical protein
MTGTTSEYKVEQRLGERGTAILELVRYEVQRGLLRSRRRRVEVLARLRAPQDDPVRISRHHGELGEAADHASRGEFGNTVDVRSERDGIMRVRLIARAFKGENFVTEILADRTFDAADDASLVNASEFAAELRGWAEDRNDELALQTRADLDADSDAEAQRVARDRAAQQLAGIVARAGD